MIAEEQGDTGPQRRHLGERQVDEDDFPFHHVQSEIHEERWQQQARRQRPLHDLPGYLEVSGIHFASANPVAMVFTR